MTTLVWNLEENATRRHLLAEALLQLPVDFAARTFHKFGSIFIAMSGIAVYVQ